MMGGKVALVLGGGGIRGLAHVGVLELLRREQVPVDMVVGTSMGAVVGAMFALDLPPEEITAGIELAMSMSFPRVRSLSSLKYLSAQARQQRFRIQLALVLGERSFADLKLPLTVMAVDMAQGEEVTLRSGPLIPALLASSAVPALFPPVVIEGRPLADGGVIDSLATHVAFAQGADQVIAVDVHPSLNVDEPWLDPVSDIMGFQLPALFPGGSDPGSTPTMLAALWRTARVQTWYLHQKRLCEHPPHLLLRPAVGHYGSLDFKDLAGPIDAGREEAERQVEGLRRVKQAAGR